MGAEAGTTFRAKTEGLIPSFVVASHHFAVSSFSEKHSHRRISLIKPSRGRIRRFKYTTGECHDCQIRASFDAGLPEILETSIGRVTVGAAGLLSVLETQLGLVIPRESQAKRLVQYRSCLLQFDSPRRFYHQSFHADPFGVSKSLLSWRDQWYLVGWDGTFAKRVGKRLRDMADVEQRACSEVAACAGQRLQAVLKALESRKTQIEKIELIDAIPSGFWELDASTTAETKKTASYRPFWFGQRKEPTEKLPAVQNSSAIEPWPKARVAEHVSIGKALKIAGSGAVENLGVILHQLIAAEAEDSARHLIDAWGLEGSLDGGEVDN
jgi:hypothetical protein